MTRPPIDQQVTFLYTSDLEKTAGFYENTLGLSLVLDQGVCRIYRASGDAFLGFCQHLEAAERPEGVILTLVSQEVDQWHQYLLERDVPIEKAPALYPKFNIYHLFLRDPNGYLIEIQRFLDPTWPRAKTDTHQN
jgi:catechol 2,3-dioxygenase-like lactoylglutathione lyase family enzyme